MNRLEQILRRSKAEFGEQETIALVAVLYGDAPSKCQQQKILRTAALVLGVGSQDLLRTVGALDELVNTTTLRAPDGEVIFSDGKLQGQWAGRDKS